MVSFAAKLLSVDGNEKKAREAVTRTGQIMGIARATVTLYEGRVAGVGVLHGSRSMLAGGAGRVVSAEGPMEGVVVSARKAGSPVTVSVVSGADGRYSFPGERLEPGSYALRIRASGYERENSVTAGIANGATAPIELRLRKAQDLSAQLTNAEWLQSFPGTSDQKKFLYA